MLDANILVRAVLGRRSRSILQNYMGITQFLVADAAVEEARAHLPGVLLKRRLDPAPNMDLLNRLIKELDIIDSDTYGLYKRDANARIARRDINDWPTATVALTFDCAIWTEDTDFSALALRHGPPIA